uniref:Uncharacterized protein n=1 Tax=Rhizophora mucronata TaxID=61149 RepID=A0A2P2IV54_RHIMU
MPMSNSGLPMQDLNCFCDPSSFQVPIKRGIRKQLGKINKNPKPEDTTTISKNPREWCRCFSVDECIPQGSQQVLFWQREQAVHDLSAFLVHGLDKK